jgi:DNA-directed RNA polymerase specialized sigma24 family protein
MMDTAVSTIPPFERFYEQHRDEVFGYLVRLVGRQAAEDAFQETFLRALRGYPTLAHGRQLRAWAFTIATRVVLDLRRRREPAPLAVEPGTTDEQPSSFGTATTSNTRTSPAHSARARTRPAKRPRPVFADCEGE